MKDQDYIRKAVWLASGWEEFNSTACKAPDHDILFYENQWTLDTLAAQLVRQVDASAEKNWVLTTSRTSQVHIDGWVQPYEPGDDRTINTIKAIVDSGVLSKEMK